jgi:hypothetical protein
MNIKPRHLETIGLIIALPSIAGAFSQSAVAAYEGDHSMIWCGLVVMLAGQAWRWSATIRDRIETAEDHRQGVVGAIAIDERGDGRDAHHVQNAEGETVFTVWAKPGRYKMGEKLKMRQWVERRP